MNLNYHYAAIKVIARHAGFSEHDAQLIAYASQFVDDAVLHKPLLVDRDPGVEGVRYDDGRFDPICTAHRDIDYVTNMSNVDAHEKVYVCFHFIPAFEGDPHTAPYRRTRKDADLARDFVAAAIEEVRIRAAGGARARALIRLGLALHGYADTWAHQGFSGYRFTEDNGIGEIEVRRDGRWRQAGLGTLLAAAAAPDLGHAGAGSLPDDSDAVWGCTPGKTTARRDNGHEFLEASESIFALLQRATGGGRLWQALRPELEYCLRHPAGDVGSSRSSWVRAFPALRFEYDQSEWFDAALTPDVGEDARDDEATPYQLAGDKRFFYFHAEAKAQREAVMARLRPNEAQSPGA